MNMHRLASSIALLTLLLTQTLQADSIVQIDSPQTIPSWSVLKFEANKFGLAVSADVHRETLDSTESLTQLEPATEQTALQPSQAQITRLTLTSQYAGQTITFTSWLEPPTGRVLQSIRTRHTLMKDEEKIYRFTTDGMLQIKRRDGKEIFEQIKLTDYQPYLNQLSQPIYLFYLASAASDLNQINDTVRLPIYANLAVYLLELNVSEELQIPTRYVRGADVQQAAVRYVDALRIDITARPLGPLLDDSEPVNIAGIENGITLHVERDTRIPLELRGEMGMFGEVRYELQSMLP